MSTHNMFLWRNIGKKNINTFWLKKVPYLELRKRGLALIFFSYLLLFVPIIAESTQSKLNQQEVAGTLKVKKHLKMK